MVDDEPEVLSTLEGILRHHGAEVLTATSANEALQLLNQHQPTVLVSDLAMPGQDGFDLQPLELVGQIAQLAGRTAIQ